MSDAPLPLEGVFPKRDPLVGVTSQEVGPAIAAALGLPDNPPNAAQKSDSAVKKSGFNLISLATDGTTRCTSQLPLGGGG